MCIFKDGNPVAHIHTNKLMRPTIRLFKGRHYFSSVIKVEHLYFIFEYLGRH